MDETKAIAEKMKVIDLAEQLGLILGVKPVWKGGYVIFDNNPVAMVLAIDTGCWKIATGDFGVLNLPQEAVELMAQMGEMVMKSEQNGTTVILLKDGDKIEAKENVAVVNAKYNQADWLDTEELMSWMGSGGSWPFPDPNNRFKVTEKETGKEISLSPKQVKQIIVEETEDEQRGKR